MPKIFFFILLFSFRLCAQTAPARVSVKSKNYYHYEWTKELNSCNDSETEDTASVRCTWLVAYNYPCVKTSDVSFTQLINEAVRSTFDHTAPSSKQIQLSAWKCLEDKPGEDLMSYKIYYKGTTFLSFTIFKDYEPSGMGNGFRHDAIPFTFDLEKKKQLKMGDIIKKNSDTSVYKIIIVQLKQSNPGLFTEFGEINNPDLFHPFSLLGYPFALTQKSIILYYPLSFGGKYAYEEIEIKFSENPELFDDQRVLHFIQTKTK